MERRGVLGLAVLLYTIIISLSGVVVCGSAQEARNPASDAAATAVAKPNFVLFYVDDMGYGDLGCFGAPTTRTPNIDGMASQGARLTQFYTAHSICTPSRAALMTGRLAVRSGMCGNAYGSKDSSQPMVLACDAKYGLPLNETTIAESLKSMGYSTMMIGKWHLGQQSQYQPTRQGFDHYFGLPYSVDMGFAYGNDTQEKDGLAKTCYPVPIVQDEKIIEQPANYSTLTQRYAEKAVQYISSEAEAGKPFFLYLAFSHVHVPQFAAGDRIGKSERGYFGDSVEEMDAAVGTVLDAVRSRSSLSTNTFAFLTSDNGAIPSISNRVYSGNNGLLSGRKAQTWEGGVREPAVAWWPGTIQPRQVVMDVAVTTDVFATFTELAGGQLPSDRVMDSISMLQILNVTRSAGASGDIRNVSFFYQGCQLWAVRLGPWKAHFYTSPKPTFPLPNSASVTLSCSDEIDTGLVATVMGTPHSPPLLFNVENDPSEDFPLSGHGDVLKEVQAAVATHQAHLTPGAPRLPFHDPHARLCCSEKTNPPCYCNKQDVTETS